MRSFGCLFLLLAASALAQNPSIDSVLKQLEGVAHFEEVSISPDGARVAWVLQASGTDRNSAIYVLDRKARGAAPLRITAGDGKTYNNERGVAWSPDSRRIAFLSNASQSQQPQIYVSSRDGGVPKKITRLKGYLADLRWSPDGNQLAVLFAENAEAGGGPLEAVPAETGVIGSEIHNQRIAIVDLKTGKVRQVSPADLHIYEYDWSPDGARFAAIAAPGPGDNNWWIAQLYIVTADSGKKESIYRPPASRQMAVPRWSPDGKRIAFIGGLMSDAGFNGGDIFAIEAAGGEPRNLTPGRKSSPSWVAWTGPEKLVFTEQVDGGGAVSTLNPADGQTETLWRGDEQLHDAGNFPNFSLARDGRTSAIIRQSWERPPEIWAGPLGEWQTVTHANAAQRPQWGPAKSVVWNNEGFRVQGWLLYPRDFHPARRYPMVVEVHGGPANAAHVAWPTTSYGLSVLASQGYFVFFPNPRGSYGQGEDFTRANVKDFGGGDLRDILAGVDAVLKTVPVDPNRIGVSGWSYGGFMTMWAVTQTDRFRAAVAGAGIVNWQSYYGENSIDQWMIPYFGASVYDDPAVYAKSSAINFIRQVKTPTLVLVGERDGECPAPQSYEFWHALRARGVKTELVVYAGEGHMFRDPEHCRDVMRRIGAWFDAYLSRD